MHLCVVAGALFDGEGLRGGDGILALGIQNHAEAT
jgi:hypothetical protein